jgi:uncharacterized protein (TIGR03545 family)
MTVADPCDAAKCLFAAEGCELEVAAAPLLAKQVVVSKARLSGMRFGDATTECRREHDSDDNTARWFHDQAVEAARDRLARMDDPFEEKFLDRLESVRRTAELCSRWPDEIAALHERAAALEASADELELSAAAASGNPLRNRQRLDDVSTRVTELRKNLECLCSDFDLLPQQLEEQRRAIVAARRQDEKFVRDKLQVETIDAKLLNAYLLREPAAQQLDGLITWMRCLREMAPTDESRFVAGSRGENVLFAGHRPQPPFLIRALELQGETCIVGQPVAFRGLVSSLTSTPSIHGEPIQLRFSGKDPAPFEVQATIDRTRGRVRDELFVKCGEIPLGDRSLGQSDGLQLSVAPSTGSLTVSISVEGDRLAGDIRLVEKQVRMTPVFAGQADTLPIGEPLDQSLGKLDSLATRISLHGTIDQPACTLVSDLGPAVAEALEQGLRHQAEAHARIVLEEARRHVDERLAYLERQVAEHREKFASQVATMPQRIDAIARSQARGERMSVEQAGRRLPTTSILR